MKISKKFFSIILSVLMIFSFTIPAMAANNEPIVISNDFAYYDPDLNATVVSFTKNPDGSLNYLTKAEVERIMITSENIPYYSNNSTNPPAPYDYREWYEFKLTSGPTQVSGTPKKVTADLQAPAGGGSISKNVSTTVTHSFSANVSSPLQESAIQAGCGFSWTKSASNSVTYQVNLLPGQRGYISFTPYYDKVVGDLSLYSNWDGYISTIKNAEGYSVKLNSEGEADGLYQFVSY